MGGYSFASSQLHHHQLQQQQQQQSSMAVRPSHGQIIANIENNPLHYERDWQLDDSSQSSFKPCPQGSGSMTPFHDSVHNMYETTNPSSSSAPVRSSSHSTNGSIAGDLNAAAAKTNDLNLFKVTNNHPLNYPNSAVFLENSDILNDAEYPKLYHRHSTVMSSVGQPPLTTTEITDNLDKYQTKDTRRYSDTKLLQQQQRGSDLTEVASPPIFNVTNVLGKSIPSAQMMAEALATSSTAINITDIIFESNACASGGGGGGGGGVVSGGGGSTFDPLELNIKEMLELDGNHKKMARLSLNNLPADTVAAAVTTTNRNIFKSLPNLSASSENLLQKDGGGGGGRCGGSSN